MTAKEKAKANKLFNTFSQSQDETEKETAKSKLFDLLKKNKASLKDFVSDLTEENAKLFDFSSEVTQVNRNYLLSDRSIKTSHNEKSRRKLVIEMLRQNKFTKREIAAILTQQYDIADMRNNLKCVSGTMNDLASNKKASFKIDSETEKVQAVFAS